MVLRLLDEVPVCVPVGIYCGDSSIGVFGEVTLANKEDIPASSLDMIQIDSVGVMYAHKVVDSALVKLT